MDVLDFGSVEFIPGLPPELGLECLARLSHTSRCVASGVCRHWHRLLRSAGFYQHRKKWGHTRKAACLVQSLPAAAASVAGDDGGEDAKQGRGSHPAYGITLFDPATGSWERLPPVPKYPGGLPLFCQACGSEGRLVVMGGWDPASYEAVRDVFVYEFAGGRWRQGREMPSTRSFFAMGAAGDGGGVVYVAGGHDEGKNALSSAWAYDSAGDRWWAVGGMQAERDECEGAAVGGEFWVVSGYATEGQGAFAGGAEAYDPRSGGWRSVEGAWPEGRCPRGCVGTRGEAGLVHWGEAVAEVRVAACAVSVGDRVLLAGSPFEGAAQGLFLVAENREGQIGKLERVSAPDEFSGFVQSGCCLEI